MGKFVDYTGKKINNWNIISQDGFNKHNESMWIAECNCSNKTKVVKTLSSLKRFGKCNECVKREKLEERKKSIIGKKYGMLTIIDYYGYRDDVATTTPFWVAECDCGSGKQVIATHYEIKSGRVKSCGCTRSKKPDLSMVGKTFNRLTVKKLDGKNSYGSYVWICDCECGSKNIKVETPVLKSGAKKSCGCLRDEIASINGKIFGSRRKKYNDFAEQENYYIGICDKGEFLFDKEDYNKVIKINKYWTINNIGYVLCYIGGKEYQLHRYIMGLSFYNPKNDIIVDHINGNKLDNRKSNLRICKKKNNPKNCSLYSNNTSGHKGISWIKRLEKWQVNIQVDNNQIYLGIYKDIKQAIKVRKEAEIKYFGEYSRDYGSEVICDD